MSFSPSVFQRRYIFHLLFWLIYALVIVVDKQNFRLDVGWPVFLLTFFIQISLMAVLVYGNTLVLFPMLLFRRKIAGYVVGIILLVLLYAFLRSAYDKYLWGTVQGIKERDNIRMFFGGNSLAALWFLVISSMLFITQKWFDQTQHLKNIQINQLQSELKYLREQLNPHFLFNGLNTIYGNIDIKDQRARNILLRFADLLRYNLYEADTDKVELAKEITYLENYVALQKARSNQNLDILLEVSVHDKNIEVAPLLFIPFVENAFKYVTRGDERSNYVHIKLEEKEKRIIFRCNNSCEKEDGDKGGIGLVNVRRRLDLLYENHYTLDIKKNEDNYSVQLNLVI